MDLIAAGYCPAKNKKSRSLVSRGSGHGDKQRAGDHDESYSQAHTASQCQMSVTVTNVTPCSRTGPACARRNYPNIWDLAAAVNSPDGSDGLPGAGRRAKNLEPIRIALVSLRRN